ncbi:MAG: RsmD family RNA methyltransferase, partial [Sphingobium sp.]
MRIISGKWRGRSIIAPKGLETRPTADRARETLFSMLYSRLGTFEGLSVADMFAGSGALGLEALSRGAEHCLFVDQDGAAIDAINANARTLEAGKAAEVRRASVL